MMLSRVGSVRHALAAATSEAHQDLHVHPWISRLARPDLQLQTYAAVLEAYHAFFVAIEAKRRRLHAYDDLSLAPQILAMNRDLTDMKHQYRFAEIDGGALFDDNALAILGALYALHGAGFGAKTLNANIKTAIPDAPHRYFALGTSANVWRSLTAQLDRFQAAAFDDPALCDGATQTFVQFGAFVSAFCEADAGQPHAVCNKLSGRKQVDGSGHPVVRKFRALR